MRKERNKTVRKPRPILWPDWRQILIPVVCILFQWFMTMFVLEQNHALEVPFGPENLYIGFMMFTAVFVLVGSVYSIAADANFTCLISTVGILLAIGASYQFLFDGFMKYCVMGVGCVMTAVAVYIICRQIRQISDLCYYGIVGLIAILTLVNLIFGKEDKGARLAVDLGFFTLQPGEPIKILLIALGASAYQNRKRALIYCATAVASCVMLLMINDLGNMIVIFAMFVFTTYMLFDSRKFSCGLIAVAAVGLAMLICVKPHAIARITNWTKVMELRGKAPLQFGMMRSVLFGGIDGRGLADAASTLRITAAEHDCAMGGVMAIYGMPVACLAMGAYAILTAYPAFNRSVHPNGFLVLCQMSVYVFTQSGFNLGGTLDLLPFTGIACALISEGANVMLCFGALLGMAAAAIHPAVKWKED